MGKALKALGLTRGFVTAGGVRIDVLRGVDLSVPAGASLALVGPSGSGKSTLLSILGALDRPDAGEVWLGGEELVSLPERARETLRGRRIGFVFQQALLLPQLTAQENVLVAAWAVGSVVPYREEARRLLDRVGLGNRLQHVPAQLSGGECQRVALARALLLKPELLLADEPTGSVDAAVADQLADLLCELQMEHRTTLVVVTHAAAVAARMSRALRLVEGRLAAP
jgi:predicted ABC-type transport system involved in lysophospholipase L1 biosynthesis ATPase subunit